MAKMEVLHLTPTERGELQSYLRKRNLPASVAPRMRIVLLLEEGTSYRDIEEKLGAAPSTISRWKKRYEKDGVLGLATIHPGQPPQKLTPQFRAKVLERTRQAPPDGSPHWSLRKRAGGMKVKKNWMARIWKEADLKPHQLERYMASNDPQFEEKAAAIIGLYLNPPPSRWPDLIPECRCHGWRGNRHSQRRRVSSQLNQGQQVRKAGTDAEGSILWPIPLPHSPSL